MKPLFKVLIKRGYSSAGRASALQAEGQRFDPVYLHHLDENPCGGIAQLGEHLLCKQRVNGSIPFTSTILKDVKQTLWGYSSAGRASALQAEGQRFDPVYLHHLNDVKLSSCGGIAQLGEHLLCKQRVNGSIPFTSTI